MKQSWWGYKHTNGNFQAKRFLSPLDIREAQESPFCDVVVGPFEAEDRDQALSIVENMVNEKSNDTPKGR